MAALPAPTHSTVTKIFQHYEDNQEDGRRPHLGASVIGKPCERALWFSFRWATIKRHPGRLLRLFETGQLAEARFVTNLKAIGVDVSEINPATGKQYSISDFGGHFSGSMDGVGLGFPEAPKSWAVLEFKTHSAKSFADLVKHGVAKSKSEHMSQVQTYMGYTGMERAAYLAVNKDTDDLYFEWIHFDPTQFAQIKARAERIIRAAEPPLRISNDPSFFQCKFCDHWETCHGVKAPAVSCRTCIHSTPEVDGDRRWSCQHFEMDIGYIAQLESHQCQAHRFIPILLEKAGHQVDVTNGDVVYDSGAINGPGGVTSNEIALMEDITMLGEVTQLKVNLRAQGIGSEVVK